MISVHAYAGDVCMCMPSVNSLADGADEAGGVVGLPEGRHHLSFNKVPTAMAACSMQPLVVQCAQILAILHEETTLCQVTTTHWAHTQTDNHAVLMYMSNAKFAHQKEYIYVKSF